MCHFVSRITVLKLYKYKYGFALGPAGSEETEAESVCPYSLTGSVAEPGLGLLTWWS